MRKVKNILLIDDDPMSNFLTKSLLIDSDASEQVYIAENGKDGLSMLRDGFVQEGYPELVFLDINMPIMDGIEFLKIYERDSELKGKNKIVLLTSSINRNDIDRAKNFQIAGFINKPLTKAKFQKLLEDI